MAKQKYNAQTPGIASKIILPMNQSAQSFQFKCLPLQMDKETFIKHWGEKDGNSFVSKALQSYPIYIVAIDLNQY